MGTNLVPGVTPASILAASLETGSGPAVPVYFSDADDAPDLPSLISEVVWMPSAAVFGVNWLIQGILQSLGWATGNVTVVSAAYTPLPTDAIIEADATAGAFTVTLPDATQEGFVLGQRYTVKKVDTSAHAVTVATSAGQLIDGGSTVVLSAAYSTTGVYFDGANWGVWEGLTTTLIAGGVLVPVVKTANYTASPGDLVLANTASGNITVTLPAAPPDKSVIGVKIFNQPGTNTVTVQRGGSDTFDNTSGTSRTITLQLQGSVYQYDAALTTWVTVSGNLSLGQLDTRYLLLTGGTMAGVIAMGANKITGLANGTASTDGAAFGQTPAGGSGLPMTTLGDLLYENATPAPARLAGNTTGTKNFLAQTGTGSVSAAPAWGTIAAGDLPTGTTSAQGALQLDGTSGDIAALGTQAAGAVGKAADAGHVHPTAGLLTKVAATAVGGVALINGTQTIISWTAPNDGALHRVFVIFDANITVATTGGATQYTYTNPGGVSQSPSLVAGTQTTGAKHAFDAAIVEANTTVTVSQTSAMTAGTETVWAEIWAS